jgi:hypothetical protein
LYGSPSLGQRRCLVSKQLQLLSRPLGCNFQVLFGLAKGFMRTAAGKAAVRTATGPRVAEHATYIINVIIEWNAAHQPDLSDLQFFGGVDA